MKSALRPLLALALVAAPSAPVSAQSRSEVQQISLDSLLNVDVSTASRHTQKVRQAPASMTVITREDIVRFGYHTLPDVLQRVRGFYLSDDLNYTYLGVRGFSRPTDYNNRVLLLLNGLTLNEGMYGLSPLGTDVGVDLDAVERIEIARGPASALYGSSAMFAVINIVTRSAETLEGIDVTAQAGSRGFARASVTAGQSLPGGFDMFLSGAYTNVEGNDIYFQEFDSPETNNGMAENLDWDRYGSVLAVVRGRGFHFQGAYGSRSKGIPTAAWEALFNDPRAQTRDVTTSFRAGFERPLSARTQVTADAYFARYSYTGSYPYEVGSEYGDSTISDRLGVDGQLIWDIAPSHRLVMGANVVRHLRADYRASSDNGQDDSLGDFPFTVAGIYAQHEATLTRTVTLTTGIRHDRTSGERSATAPRVALIYSPSQRRTLKLLYGEAFRVPSPYERNYYPLTQDLRREHIRTFEAVWEERLADWLRGELSVYHYSTKDLIDTVVDETDGSAFFANRSHVDAPGFEAELEARLPSGLSVWTNYALQLARLDDEELTNAPRHLGKVGVSAPLFASLRAMAEARHESGRLTLAGSRTDEVFVARTGLSFDATHRVHASLVVENVFNAEYATPGGAEHIQSAIPQPGRNVRVGLGVRF
jgi:iron complex outermembrane receptor protein